MIILPLKWMPYLLVVCGLICLFSGEAPVGVSIIMTLVGAVWTLLKHACKSPAANQQ